MKFIYEEYYFKDVKKLIEYTLSGYCIECFDFFASVDVVQKEIPSKHKKDLSMQFLVGYCIEKWNKINIDKAIKIYKKLKKYPPAAYRLAWIYLEGNGVKASTKKALKLFEYAAKNDYAPAIYSLAELYCYVGNKEKYNIPIDINISYQYYQKTVDLNYPKGLYHKGLLCAFGNKYDLAISYYEQALDLNSHYAAIELVKLYKEGEVVPKNLQKALEVCRKNEKAGFHWKNEIENLNKLINKEEKKIDNEPKEEINKPKVVEEEKTPEELLKEVESGFVNNTLNSQLVDKLKLVTGELRAEALFLVGLCYSDGKGVKENEKTAALWYEKSAKLGHIKAKYNLALIYEKNDEFEKAFNLYQENSEADHIKSQHRLADYYYFGLFVEQDFTKSFYWYEKIKNDRPDALYKLARHYEKGLGCEKDIKKAMELHIEAALKI